MRSIFDISQNLLRESEGYLGDGNLGHVQAADGPQAGPCLYTRGSKIWLSYKDVTNYYGGQS